MSMLLFMFSRSKSFKHSSCAVALAGGFYHCHLPLVDAFSGNLERPSKAFSCQALSCLSLPAPLDKLNGFGAEAQRLCFGKQRHQLLHQQSSFNNEYIAVYRHIAYRLEVKASNECFKVLAKNGSIRSLFMLQIFFRSCFDKNSVFPIVFYVFQNAVHPAVDA